MISVHEQRTEGGHYIGWLTLNLPQTLNALTLDMVRASRIQLQQWSTRANIACVVIQGDGRGFCAGGDVRRLRKGILAGDDYCARFFEQEYRLDYDIHCYPKPVLCWGHGIVMGGGLGILVGASHRVVTPTSRLAMPEVSIGLYPDVGSSWFLSRLPHNLGLFLGISGCEWNGADAVKLGLADFLVADSARHLLESSLMSSLWTNDKDQNSRQLTQILQALPPGQQSGQLLQFSEMIANACKGSLGEILKKVLALPLEADWLQQAKANIRSGCPVTIRLVEEQLKRTSTMSLADVLRLDWIMSMQCAARPDFPEGVRAQLVDKDRQPCWSYASVDAILDQYINEHFICPVEKHPLADLA